MLREWDLLSVILNVKVFPGARRPPSKDVRHEETSKVKLPFILGESLDLILESEGIQ